LDEHAVVIENGQSTTFCSAMCMATAAANPEEYSTSDPTEPCPENIGSVVACPVCENNVTVNSMSDGFHWANGQHIYACDIDGHVDELRTNIKDYIHVPVPDPPSDQLYCPVCGMSVVAGNPTLNLVHGQHIVFCSAGCHAAFVADPSAYYSTGDTPVDGALPSESAMAMFFTSSTEVTILFEDWVTDDYTTYMASIVAVMAIAVFNEWLVAMFLMDNANSDDSAIEESVFSVKMKSKGFGRLLRAFLYGAIVSLSYLLMLVAMTFNAGLFVAVILGYSGGFALFRKPLISSYHRINDSREDSPVIATVSPIHPCCQT